MAQVEVLIVGAGPTGLTLACELARRGIAIRVIEASPGPQPGSRGKGIQPRTLEVLDNLGVVDRVLANGRLGMPIRSVGPDGREQVRGTATPQPTPDAPYATSLITPEWRIEEALRDRLAEFGGEVSFGTELLAFQQSAESVLTRLATDTGPQAVTARWLVGCDGGRSTVRHLAGIAFLGETMEDVRMIVADVGIDGLDREHWHMWQGAEGFLALCPLPSTDIYQLQASIAPGQDPTLTLGNMQALVESRSGQGHVRLREPAWTSLWRCNVRMVDRYIDRRVVLAGDAAHVHSPAGGQGMNTGIQDAHNLGWKLAAVLRGAPTALLDTYDGERMPVAASVLALSSELLQKAIETRGIVIDRTARTTQLGINYRASSLSHDDLPDDAPLRAGDRAPDAPGLRGLSRTVRLFDLLRGGAVSMLAFGTDVSDGVRGLPDQIRVIRIADAGEPSADMWIDTRGLAYKHYGAQPGMVIVIRPDGYIGLIAADGAQVELERYVAKLFNAP